MQPFTLGRNKRIFDQPKSSLELNGIFEPVTTIVDLSTLKGDKAKTLLSQLLCKKVYDYV
jgi:hypothetical protein